MKRKVSSVLFVAGSPWWQENAARSRMIPSACAASPSSPSGGSGVALRSAAAGGDVSAVERFLGGRRQVRFARDELGRTALHLAASAGHVPVVRTLLQAAAHRELDAADAAGCTALQRAAADGHEVVVRLLIDNGALLDKQDSVVRYFSAIC